MSAASYVAGYLQALVEAHGGLVLGTAGDPQPVNGGGAVFLVSSGAKSYTVIVQAEDDDL